MRSRRQCSIAHHRPRPPILPENVSSVLHPHAIENVGDSFIHRVGRICDCDAGGERECECNIPRGSSNFGFRRTQHDVGDTGVRFATLLRHNLDGCTRAVGTREHLNGTIVKLEGVTETACAD